MHVISRCRSCESPNIRPFFHLGSHPLANSLPESATEFEEIYPLSLSFCTDCSLVQLNETIDPSILFSRYVWVTGTSKGALEFSHEFCRELLQRTSDPKAAYILEIGSNDGTFLKPLLREGYQALGVDPARNICALANTDGVPTQCAFWSEHTARTLVSDQGKASAIFARNVLAHVASLNDFVAGISECLADDGTAAVEVHYAAAILKGLQYDSIYHEHLCYFTLRSLEALFLRHGLHVFDILHSPISGGALIAYARKSLTHPSDLVLRCREAESQEHINEFYIWKAFAERAFRHREELRELLAAIKSRGESIIGWGASARSSTLLNFCKISSETVSVIVDQNPLKHGRYTAGTRIPIRAPEEVLTDRLNTIMITGWNFADEISEQLKEAYQFAGSVILPLPNKPIVKAIQ